MWSHRLSDLLDSEPSERESLDLPQVGYQPDEHMEIEMLPELTPQPEPRQVFPSDSWCITADAF